MRHTEQRRKLRAHLAGRRCLSPASVFDPLSARIAESVGYEVGMLAGMVASNVTLAAPDLILITLTEFTDLVRRIMRSADLSLLVDADHGYGNALNVIRTVQELEHAGVSALTIEDTVLPVAFGVMDRDANLISVEEGFGKMKAAVAARSDPSLVIAARTSALKSEGLDGTIARVRAYSSAGVDAIFIIGLDSVDQLRAIRGACGLPVLLGPTPPALEREELALHGARILLQGHQAYAAAIKSVREVYSHLFSGGAPGDLKDRIASQQEIDRLVRSAYYRRSQQEFLG